jgi:hypothetical protein
MSWTILCSISAETGDISLLRRSGNRGVNLNIRLYLLPRLRISRAIPPFPAICLHDTQKDTQFILEVTGSSIVLENDCPERIFDDIPHFPCKSVSQHFLFDEFLQLSEKFNVFLRILVLNFYLKLHINLHYKHHKTHVYCIKQSFFIQ